MTHLSDATVEKFINWMKNYCIDDKQSFDDIINDEELLLKYANDAIYFNVLSTYENDMKRIKANLKQLLKDYMDALIDNDDVDYLIKRSIFENNGIVDYELDHYLTHSFHDYLNHLSHETFQYTDGQSLVDAFHSYIQNH